MRDTSASPRDLSWMATTHPVIAVGVVGVLLVAAALLIRAIVRLARRWLLDPLLDSRIAPRDGPTP